MRVEVDAYLGSGSDWSDGVFLGARVDTGGCWTMYSEGFFFYVFPYNNTVLLTGNFSKYVIGTTKRSE